MKLLSVISEITIRFIQPYHCGPNMSSNAFKPAATRNVVDLATFTGYPSGFDGEPPRVHSMEDHASENVPLKSTVTHPIVSPLLTGGDTLGVAQPETLDDYAKICLERHCVECEDSPLCITRE